MYYTALCVYVYGYASYLTKKDGMGLSFWAVNVTYGPYPYTCQHVQLRLLAWGYFHNLRQAVTVENLSIYCF